MSDGVAVAHLVDIAIDPVVGVGLCNDFDTRGPFGPENHGKIEGRMNGLVQIGHDRRIVYPIVLGETQAEHGILVISARSREEASELSEQEFMRQFREAVANRS